MFLPSSWSCLSPIHWSQILSGEWRCSWSSTDRRYSSYIWLINKANLRDLIAATGLVILLELDQNRQFFSPWDLEIWWMTPKNNRAPLLCYFKLFALFRSYWWIQTGFTVWKCPIWVQIDDFLSLVTLQFDRWPWKTIGYLFNATSRFAHHFIAIGEFNWSYSLEMPNLG